MLKRRNVELSVSRYNIKSPYSMKPVGITIHETDNNATAANEIAYMQRNDNEVSFHFAVDENEAVQGLPLNRNGWHAGDGYSGPGNRTTIAIEICRNYRTEDLTNYYKARANAEILVGQLLKEFGWTDKDIYTHNDWNGKNCPRVILKEGYLSQFKKNAMAHKVGGSAQVAGNSLIMGKQEATVDDLYNYVVANNKSFNKKIAESFIRIGAIYGVRGDIALAQSILETGWFKFEGSSVKPEQNNFCGMGATGGGVAGNSFNTIDDGVEAQIQHLFAYATKSALPAGRTLLDPRFKYVTRGIAPKWTDLNGRWATGANYGEKILNIFNGVSKSTPAPVKPQPTKPTLKPTSVIAQEVLAGKWGNGQDRKDRLTKAGYDYNTVQNAVNGINKPATPSKPALKSTPVIAQEVLAGKWGNGQDRKDRLTKAGYNYDTIQAEVNKGNKPAQPARKSNRQIAVEIINGKGGWGNNPGRKQKLEAAGYNYNAIQAEVNKLLQ